MKHLLLLLVVMGTCALFAQNPTPLNINLVVFKTGMLNPVGVYNCGDHRLFILEQNEGDIEIVDTSGTSLGKFLDLTGLISTGGERGLLGLAFHPNYAVNGFFYVNYTNLDGNTVIARYTVSGNPNIANAGSAQILMTITQDFANHNGGNLAFGPDGYLYIGMGDGGSGGDPNNRAQNPLSRLGKMLRIDVDGGTPYAIPPTNPFFGQIDTLPEIWALGMRNPWKFSFDALTGDLWIGDVGQNAWEEIDLELAGSPGGYNWGWRCYEGNVSYNLAGCQPMSNYDFPVAVYSQALPEDFCSIIGGIVYRGSTYPGMYGYYILTDYCEGGMHTLYPNGLGGYIKYEADAGPGFGNVALGTSSSGEMYLANVGGTIYKVTDACGSFNPQLTSDGDGNLLATDGESQYWWWHNGTMVTGTGAVSSYAPTLEGTWYATVNNGSGCTRKTNELQWVIAEGVPGCTYADALNYDPAAGVDDGSCLWAVMGCTDEAANNYDAGANTDDGSCLYGMAGCLEPVACNYSPDADYHDATLCEFDSCWGCTQSCALNYDPDAIYDDGSCTGCIDCMGDLNGDLVVNITDLLMFVGAFGTICNE
ncbi:MAG: PQQ-dependent sugar dehydrogenase [Flavobacteriales bacterium]|nr:PQQ-dependent sugar dehydrogenase [Flavobacteriales bacterium]